MNVLYFPTNLIKNLQRNRVAFWITHISVAPRVKNEQCLCPLYQTFNLESDFARNATKIFGSRERWSGLLENWCSLFPGNKFGTGWRIEAAQSCKTFFPVIYSNKLVFVTSRHFYPSPIFVTMVGIDHSVTLTNTLLTRILCLSSCAKCTRWLHRIVSYPKNILLNHTLAEGLKLLQPENLRMKGGNFKWKKSFWKWANNEADWRKFVFKLKLLSWAKRLSWNKWWDKELLFFKRYNEEQQHSSFWGCIFSRVRPFYERALSNLDP